MSMEFFCVDCSNVEFKSEAIEFGANPRNMRYNRYQHFSKFIHAMYPDAKTILEIGCGNGYLSELLNELGYNVTALDYKKYNNLDKRKIKYLEKEFTIDTNIDEYDLVVGLHCCEATEMIIRNCLNNDKEFAVVVCEQHQGLENKNIQTREQYIKYLKEINNALKITCLPIYEPIMNEHWGETIYYKKTIKVKKK